MPLSRRAFLGTLAAPALRAQATRPPNIVLILADDLGWADVGYQGADLHETPVIDRLARQGVSFPQAYSASPVCSPTRAALLTGKHPARLNLTTWSEAAAHPETNRSLIPPVSRDHLPHEEVTIAELLRQSGYLTALVGKWHLGEASFYPESQGFDVNIGGSHWGAPQTHFAPYSGNKRYGGEFRYVPHLEFPAPGEYLADRLTTEAISVVDRATATGKPFFLFMSHHAVHTPIEAKDADVARFAAKLKPGQHHTNAVYAAMTWNLDQNIGRLLAHLDAHGLAENTVVLFTSDNGGVVNAFDGKIVTSNAPLRSGKGSAYEGGIRVPLIARWPGRFPAGASCPVPVTSTDLFATLADLAGAPAPTGVDSLSLLPLFRRPTSTLPRETLYFHFPHYYPTTTPVSALRQGRWKLIEYFEGPRYELYDLEADPGETRDLAAREPARTAALRAELARWRSSVGAGLPRPNPAPVRAPA